MPSHHYSSNHQNWYIGLRIYLFTYLFTDLATIADSEISDPVRRGLEVNPVIGEASQANKISPMPQPHVGR